MEVRLRIKVHSITEKVLGVEVIPVEHDDGSLHGRVPGLSAREAKALLIGEGWQFAATTTSMEGAHFDLYRRDVEDDATAD